MKPTSFATVDVAAGLVLTDRYPSQTVVFANGVRGMPYLTYSTLVGYRPLTLDLYLPPETSQKPARGFPLIIYIHGGAWLAGNSRSGGVFRNFPDVLAQLSEKGYVVASVNYRLSSEAAFPAPIQDIKAATRWLRFHASEYGIDPERVMSWGASAGGHLAALAAVSGGARQLEPVPEPGAPNPDAQLETEDLSHISDHLQGGVSWYGVFDITTFADQVQKTRPGAAHGPDSPEWRMLGCYSTECKEGQIAAASPISYVNAKTPPLLLIVGDRDMTVPYLQTLEMADAMKTSGAPVELIVIPDVDHVFIGKTAEETREANLRALAATLDFIDRTIGSSNEAPAKS